jgi:aldehyde dehydrogenase (NAD+)
MNDEEYEMRELLQFYIDGEWVDPETPNPFDVINPATEEVCGRISLGSAADVDKAVAAANRAAPGFARTTRDERIALLTAILEVFERRNDEVATAIMEEMGAPWKLAKYAQAPSGSEHVRAAIDVLKDFEFAEMHGTTQIVKEPIGPCALITPWNWPINQIAVKVAPALAAGCTLVNGDGPTVGEALSSHPDIAMVSFTGSTRAGVSVAQNAAATVKRVAQELGGKSANIILDDADFGKAVGRGASACFENSGQSCNAPTRMLVPKERLAEAAEIAGKRAESTKAGDPQAEDTRIGPVVSELQWNKIQGLIQKGIDEGATLVAGGPGRPDGLEKGYYVKPTVFSDVSNDMTIAREEIFGPVLSIIPYDDEDEAVRIANDTPYGLSGYVSSGDLERARAIAARLRTGMVTH